MKRWARALTAAVGVLLVVMGIAVAAKAAGGPAGIVPGAEHRAA